MPLDTNVLHHAWYYLQVLQQQRFYTRSQGSERRKEVKSTTHLFQIYDALITPYASHYEYIA